MSTAMAATCLYDARFLFAATLGAHALMIESLGAMVEPFEEFIHTRKAHPGQQWVARRMRALLAGSQLTSQTRSGIRTQANDEEDALFTLQSSPKAMEWVGKLVHELRASNYETVSPRAEEMLLKMAEVVVKEKSERILVDPIQDRYSVRCLPQFLGPIRDGLITIIRQVEVEMNSANDNPLIDSQSARFYHGGNFLGQYTSVAMDQLRYYIGLLAKHLDAQIALLVTPEFSGGLTPSLVGNTGRSVNMGLKGLQISANSIMPLLTYLGNPIADRFPTHAEQFNQNINSQSFAAASLARQSVDMFRHYIAIALLFGLQAVDLRTALVHKQRHEATDDPGDDYLAAESRHLYRAIRQVIHRPKVAQKPYVNDDDEQALDDDIERLVHDLARGDAGVIGDAVSKTRAEFDRT
jgi:histidine ammonia-lyase